MKWIGQHIWDLTSRFRNDIYFEGLAETAETRGLVVDANGKEVKSFGKKDEADAYAIKNHDDLMAVKKEVAEPEPKGEKEFKDKHKVKKSGEKEDGTVMKETKLSEEEVGKVIESIISQTGASSMKDMGKVMGMASKQLAGKADGKTISTLVKQLLST